jgi:hypothetical protein
MFNKVWYFKNQKLLLIFANSFLGRCVLRIYGKKSSIGKNKIIKILPNCITWKIGKFYYTEFRTHDKFTKRLYYAFKPLWYLFHLWDFVWYPKFNLGFDTLTKYPDAHPESTSVDGRVYRIPTQESFSSIRTSAGTGFSDTDGAEEAATLICGTTSSNYSDSRRGIFLFDTSALTAAATISTAVFSLYVNTVSNTMSPTQSAGLVASSPASNTGLAASDYNIASWGSTRFASDLSIGSLSTSAYNDWTLNASGIAAISLTSITKFGTRLSCDIDNSEPSWSNGTIASLNVNYADAASNDPKLVVTYTVPSGFFAIL